MPVHMFWRCYLSLLLWVLVHTGNIPPLSLDDTEKGQDCDLWDRRRPSCVAGDGAVVGSDTGTAACCAASM